jgi:hypothetical protein
VNSRSIVDGAKLINLRRNFILEFRQSLHCESAPHERWDFDDVSNSFSVRRSNEMEPHNLNMKCPMGDALYVGGNDYPAKETGVDCIPVKDPDETKRVIQTIIACLAVSDQAA